MLLSCALTARNFVRWTVIFHCYLAIISQRAEMLACAYILQKATERERTLNTFVIRLSNVACAITQEKRPNSLKIPLYLSPRVYIILVSFLFLQYLLILLYSLAIIRSRLTHICINQIFMAKQCNIIDV